MAGEKNWVDGEALTADEMETIVQEQLVITTTSGAKGTPWLGKHVYCHDIDILFRFDGAAWRSYSMGLVPDGRDNVTQTGPPIEGTETLVNGSLLDVNAFVPGEVYAYSVSFNVVSSLPDQVATIRIYRDSTLIEVQKDLPCPTSGIGIPFTCRSLFNVTGAHHVLKTTIALGIGAEHLTVAAGGDVYIEHVGS